MGFNSKSSGDVRKLPLVHLAGADSSGQPWHQVCDNSGAVILETWDNGFAEWLMKYSRLSLAATSLVDKLDEIEPEITAAFLMAHVHGGPYDGPSCGVELDALRRELGKPSQAETFWEDGHTAYPFKQGEKHDWKVV